MIRSLLKSPSGGNETTHEGKITVGRFAFETPQYVHRGSVAPLATHVLDAGLSLAIHVSVRSAVESSPNLEQAPLVFELTGNNGFGNGQAVLWIFHQPELGPP